MLQAAAYELIFFTMTLIHLFTPTTPTSTNRIQRLLYELLISEGQAEQSLKELFEKILKVTRALLTHYRHLTTSADFTSEEIILGPEFQTLQNRY